MVLRIRYWLHEKKFLDVAKSLPQFVLYLRARLLILVSRRCVLAIFNTASVKAEEPKWKEALTVGSTQIPELVEVMEDHFEIVWNPSYWRQTIKAIKAKLWSAECSAFHGSTAVCFPWWWSTWWGRRADEPIRFVKWEFYKHYKSYQRKRPF